MEGRSALRPPFLEGSDGIMIYREGELEARSALQVATQMAAAARTAPKARGLDFLHTMVLDGEDKDKLADALRRLGEAQGLEFYVRDAGNLDSAQAVVLIGVQKEYRGLGAGCGYCGHKSCEGCREAGGRCVFSPIDLGIAIGSAVALAADFRVDTRVMYSAGKAALALKLFEEPVDLVMAIPVSVSGKSPFFDRKKKQ